MRISLALVVGLWLWIGHKLVIFCKFEAHSGLSHSYVSTTTASTIGANTSSLNTIRLLQVLAKDEIKENSEVSHIDFCNPY
jgi:hypothetical protein